jgi:hypothetical protein
MGRVRFSLVALASLGAALPAAAQDAPSLEALWEVIQQQQREIEELKQQVGAAQAQIAGADESIEATQEMVVATADYVESLEIPAAGGSDTTIGGYGELHYTQLDADDPVRNLDQIDFHRFVLLFGHEFNERVRFFSELELEHSLAGDGKPGEIELEQAYVEFALNDSTFALGGLFLLPLGILNETHEPPTFYGVERNSVENVIIPSTWWEAGAGVNGNFANGLNLDFALHSGLAIPTDGSNAFRVRSGRQKVAKADASNPAYTARLKYTGMPGLEVAASYQYQTNPSQVADDGLDSGNLFTTHVIYDQGRFSLRALYGKWSFSGAAVQAAGADEQSGWYVEPSFRLTPRWGVYARYEDVDGARDQDRFSQWEAGLSYWPVPGVTLKMDYRLREHNLFPDVGRDFGAFDLGIGYQF